MIQVRDLMKIYHTGDTEVRAIDGVNLEIEEEEFVAVIGKSGSGKSTLLHLLGGVDRPTDGVVMIHGENIYEYQDSELSKFRRQRVGFVFQSYNLVPKLTVEENIWMPFMLQGKKYVKEKLKEERERVSCLADMMGISDKMKSLPSELSGGQMQRAAILRALINRAKLLLCDEPTGNLDFESGEEVMRILQQVKQEEKCSVVVVTHDQLVADSADRIIQIQSGRIKCK